jgi:hypothetical protein
VSSRQVSEGNIWHGWIFKNMYTYSNTLKNAIELGWDFSAMVDHCLAWIIPAPSLKK